MDQSQINLEALKTIRHIGMRWKRQNKEILKHIFPLLAKGQPVSSIDLSKVTGHPMSEVDDAISSIRVGKNQQDRVIELFGLMLDPTPHRIEIDGVILFSCCPLVAFTIPGLVNKKIVIESVDPISRKIVKMCLKPNGEISFNPENAVASMVKTELEGILKNVTDNFCKHIHLFISRRSAEEYIQNHPRRYIVEINELKEIGIYLSKEIWKL